MPETPGSAQEAGLDFYLLLELVAKTLFNGGQVNLLDLVEHTRLPVRMLEPLLAFMRAERLCEISRRGDTETSVSYVLTESGRAHARDALARSRYAGPAPVSLESYVQQIKRQSVADLRITPEKMSEAFAGAMVDEALLDQLGAAMNSGRALFLHGPAGCGKTFIAERLVGALSGHVLVPHAIAVDSEIVPVFEPLIHKPVATDGKFEHGLDGRGPDRRWVLCERPIVVVGGELTLSMLDLHFDETSRSYTAPPQLKANNGLLVIDDFGRQMTEPQHLLNRWIAPLDRRVDHLSLHTGRKFVVPFDVSVIFSTHVTPAELSDNSFLRRLGHKISVGPLHEGAYRRLFRQVCDDAGVACSEWAVEYLLQELHRKLEQPLLASIPRELLSQLEARARYRGEAADLSEEALQWAWGNAIGRP